MTGPGVVVGTSKGPLWPKGVEVPLQPRIEIETANRLIRTKEIIFKFTNIPRE